MKKTIVTVSKTDPLRPIINKFSDIAYLVDKARKENDKAILQESKDKAKELFYTVSTLCQNNFLDPVYWNNHTDYVKNQCEKVMTCKKIGELKYIGLNLVCLLYGERTKKGRPNKPTL